MNFDLSNYNIFVAGGLGDMGSELVQVLLDANSKVKVISGSNKFSNRYKSHLKNSHLEILKIDYSSYENIFEMFQNNCVKDKRNCLISFVGTGKMEGEFPYNNKEVQRIWSINYFANRNLALAITEFLSQNDEFNHEGKSSHIFTSSVASSNNVGAPIEYSASKAALEIFIKNLSHHISPKQRINTISPGHIYTPTGTWAIKYKQDANKVISMIKKSIPLDRLGNIDDLNNAYMFFLSEFSSYLTGTNFVIDGGLSAKK